MSGEFLLIARAALEHVRIRKGLVTRYTDPVHQLHGAK